MVHTRYQAGPNKVYVGQCPHCLGKYYAEKDWIERARKSITSHARSCKCNTRRAERLIKQGKDFCFTITAPAPNTPTDVKTPERLNGLDLLAAAADEIEGTGDSLDEIKSRIAQREDEVTQWESKIREQEMSVQKKNLLLYEQSLVAKAQELAQTYESRKRE